jgi:hypothetical protein
MKNFRLEEILGLSWHDTLPQAHGRPEYTFNASCQNGNIPTRKDLLQLVIRERILSSRFENMQNIHNMSNNAEYAKYT